MAESPGNKWTKLMLITGEYADVHFLVGGEYEEELLPAHKLILKNASDVFEAMFRFDSKNAKAKNSSPNKPMAVEVPDVEPEAFQVMLSFIYSGDLGDLNGYNAMAVLYAAKKYNIPGLIGPSLEFPISKLRNVFLAFAQTRLFDMEDFSHRCLAYIDENAETLIKSEEFLQIDQKLLCEILDRDQLQITQNLRQMLGPALFKIRFPFIKKMQFWEKIIPSGVVTAEEAIGLPYPLQFPSHGRIWTKWTLLMDIEKASKFGTEFRWRYSKAVPIKGLLWKIFTYIKSKNESTDEKWLRFGLCCVASKNRNWRCVCSATFRIVSQNNEAANFTGKFDEAVLSSKMNEWAFSNLISVAELMDPGKGLYDEEGDKVTLAIDLTVQNEREEHIFYKSNGTIKMEIENLSEFAREPFGAGRFSESVLYIKEFPWKIMAQINSKNESTDQKWLGFYLWCAAAEKGRKEAKPFYLEGWTSSSWTDIQANNWSFKCSATLRIVSQKSDMADFSRDLSGQIFNELSNKSGFSNFITFTELMDQSKGFYDKEADKVKLAIDFIVKEAENR
ncbi:hypothetical protein niasHT_033982 [Heterodera trifolii]|uniref:BTB domain-containing protein n=1 Tax=Heterodera trifolii TaxID=157864 RepID=A0ABD2IAT3_9BILA